MDTFQNLYNAVRRITRPIILRNLEMSFYFLFIVLSFIGFVLPFALDINKAASYTVGVLSLSYAIGLYFLRFKIRVGFGLIMHTATLFLFLSFIIFDAKLYEIGGVFVFIALIGLFIILVLCGLGHRVFASGVNEPTVNRAWPEIDNQANVDGQIEDQINLNHWHFNNEVSPPEMQNEVSPQEMQNNDSAVPQMQEHYNINPEVQNK